jgi:hypothetical protein
MHDNNNSNGRNCCSRVSIVVSKLDPPDVSIFHTPSPRQLIHFVLGFIDLVPYYPSPEPKIVCRLAPEQPRYLSVQYWRKIGELLVFFCEDEIIEVGFILWDIFINS